MDELVKKVWEIYVPTIRKNGKPIRTRFHRVWDKKVMSVSGGLSIHRPSVGNWISPDGKIYNEKMIPVRIVATNEEILKIIDITLEHYEDEEAVLCYRISEEVIMKYRRKEE
jgi:hypothetical protein